MEKGEYLTVGFPTISLESIKGVRLCDRSTHFESPKAIAFQKIFGENPHAEENVTIWTLANYGDQSTTSDVALMQEGYIVITPMTVDENAAALYNRLALLDIPKFELGGKD